MLSVTFCDVILTLFFIFEKPSHLHPDMTVHTYNPKRSGSCSMILGQPGLWSDIKCPKPTAACQKDKSRFLSCTKSRFTMKAEGGRLGKRRGEDRGEGFGGGQRGSKRKQMICV